MCNGYEVTGVTEKQKTNKQTDRQTNKPEDK